MNLVTFDPVVPIGSAGDSRVLMTERLELTRFQIAQLIRPSYFENLLEIDHLAEVPILTRFAPSTFDTTLLMHVNTRFAMAQPKVLSASNGWMPGSFMTESTIHSWDPLNETQWNQLLRATTNVKVNGYSVCTISVSVDVIYYRASYTHEMLFKDG